MNDTNTSDSIANNEAALRALAIVGFIALVAFGIWLAIYSSRFVPAAVNRLGTAAVALTSLFRPGDASLEVIPGGMSTTTLPWGTATSTATSTKPVTHPTTPGTQTSGTYPIGTGQTGLYGSPDLVGTITAVGYLANFTTDTFVQSTTVPYHGRAAVKFVIKNVGTNVANAGWRFNASIPTQSAYIFRSDTQQALNPGDSIEYTLAFDNANTGSNQPVIISTDVDNNVVESNENNNGASATLIVLGS